jgi:alkaline phosphatase D
LNNDPSSPDAARRRLLGHALALGSLAGAPPFLRHARAADVPRFLLGVASGHPLPDSVVLWTRLMGLDLPPEVSVRWQLAHDESFSTLAAEGQVSAQATWAHSVHVQPGGLQPGRWYFYRFIALGQASPVGRTRTAPAPDAPARLSAALASCQRWEHGHYAAWRHASRQAHDLVVFVGDYIYEYGSIATGVRQHGLPMARSLDQYRERYALYKSDPALQAAHAACPWLLVWDDHEVDNDYARDQSLGLSGPAFLALRAAAYQAYWEHQPLPPAWRPAGPDMRIHHRLDWGRLARIHALDGRQHRDAQACPRLLRAVGSNIVDAADCPLLADPARSLLGPAQEQWLAEGWDTERGWNLLAQQTLMARLSRRTVATPGSGRYWMDGWDGYPQARRRLLDAARSRGVPNLVVLGGDLHAHYVADLKADFDDHRSAVVGSEFCTTSISSNGPPQLSVNRLLPLNPHLHHGRGDARGYVALALDARRLEASLVAVNRSDDPGSECGVQARFVVEAGRPGVQRA